MHEYASLENFWKRYNKVLLDKCALDKEKNVLTQENHQLRTLLKQYLDGISVNEDVINNPNPLLVVNHKTNIVAPAAYRPNASNTVVEGAHAVSIMARGQYAR